MSVERIAYVGLRLRGTVVQLKEKTELDAFRCGGKNKHGLLDANYRYCPACGAPAEPFKMRSEDVVDLRFDMDDSLKDIPNVEEAYSALSPDESDRSLYLLFTAQEGEEKISEGKLVMAMRDFERDHLPAFQEVARRKGSGKNRGKIAWKMVLGYYEMF